MSEPGLGPHEEKDDPEGVALRRQRRRPWTRSAGRSLVWLAVLALCGVTTPVEHASATSCSNRTLDEEFDAADVVAEFWVIDVADESPSMQGVQRFRVRLGRVIKGSPGLAPGTEVDVVWAGWGANFAPMDSAAYPAGAIGFFRRVRGGLIVHPCTPSLARDVPLPQRLRRALREGP